MNLVTMRAKVTDGLLGRAAISDGDLDERLLQNYIHLFNDLPGGWLEEGEWRFDTVAAQEVYPFPNWVHSPKLSIWVEEDEITVYTLPWQFWYYWDQTSSQQSRPYGALLYGEELTLRNIPDQAYAVRVKVRKYPTIGDQPNLQLATLPSTGIPNDTVALATVYATRKELADEVDLQELVGTSEAMYQAELKRLRRRDNARPVQRRPFRSY